MFLQGIGRMPLLVPASHSTVPDYKIVLVCLWHGFFCVQDEGAEDSQLVHSVDLDNSNTSVQ